MANKKKEICPECRGSGVRLLPILIPGGLPIKTELVCIRCKGLGEIKNDDMD
jgi:DnaJ-class molecular chaperone